MIYPRSSGPVFKNWQVTREIILRLIAFIAVLFLMLILIDNSLPDYASYESLFYNDIANYGFNKIFYFLVQLSKFLRLDYVSFRYLILVFGVSYFMLMPKVTTIDPRYVRNEALFYFIYIALSISFVFEFYEIRLRAGIACLMFALVFVPEIKNANKSTNVVFRLVQALLLAGSLLLHGSTFAAIFLFCAPPLVFIKYAPDWAKRLTGPFAIALAILWFGLLYQVVSVAPDRGEALYSDLNPVRFFALVAIPMVLFVVLDLPANRADREIGRGLNLFPLVFTINYLICAAVLAGFFFTGKLDLAGEAIVRIMTLSSLPAVFIIMRWGVGYATAVPTYLLLCNGLFFMNTVYL